MNTPSDIIAVIIVIIIAVFALWLIISLARGVIGWVGGLFGGNEVTFGDQNANTPTGQTNTPFQPGKTKGPPPDVFIPGGRVNQLTQDDTQHTAFPTKAQNNRAVFQGRREENPDAIDWITGQPLNNKDKKQ